MENFQFTTKNKDGNNIICDVIATYHDDDTNKDFIVYTDRTFDKDKKLRVYYSLYEKINNDIKLIETKKIEDQKIGLQLIQELIKDVNI